MLLCFVLVVLITISTSQQQQQYEDDDLRLLETGIREFFETEQPPQYFLDLVKNYQMPHALESGMQNVYNPLIICGLCQTAISVVQFKLHLGVSQQSMENLIVELCVLFDIEDRRVCRGAIHENIPIFWYIFQNKPNITGDRFCGILLQNYNCQKDNTDWSISIPNFNSTRRFKQLNLTEDDPLHIIHLSDAHYDPLYLTNGNAECGEPVCCQNDQELPINKQDQCGYWTDYRKADAPWNLIEETIRHVKTQPCDFAYFTGDVISHRVWETSIKNNTEAIKKFFLYLRENLNCTVYPTFGNHEPHPLNVWAPKDITNKNLSTQWLLDLAADLWTPWLGEETRETILKGGYYTVTPRKGFRIISVNTNLCYTNNWWLIYNDTDPYDQLKWLVDVLQQAEENNESVHILSHVPNGEDDCLHTWSREYYRIIQRFSHIVRVQFQGHTHRDEFHIYYNSSDMLDAVNVAINGASIVPYSDANPSYKIHIIDHNNYVVLDSIEWTFNLTLANEEPSNPPDWYRLYSFRETYNVTNLQPEQVAQIPEKMIKNPELIDAYFRFYYRNGDNGISGGCNNECKKNHLCSITTARSDDNTQCLYYTFLFDLIN